MAHWKEQLECKFEGYTRQNLWNSEDQASSTFLYCIQHELNLALCQWRLGQDPTSNLKAVMETYRAMSVILAEHGDYSDWQGRNEANSAIFVGMVLYRSIHPELFDTICKIPRDPKESKQFFYHYMDAQLLYAIHHGHPASDWDEALTAVGKKRNNQLLHRLYGLYMGIVLDMHSNKPQEALSKGREVAALFPKRAKMSCPSGIRGDYPETHPYMIDLVLAALLRYFGLDELAKQDELLRPHLWSWHSPTPLADPPKVSPDSPIPWMNQILEYEDGPILAQKGTYGFNSHVEHFVHNDPPPRRLSAVANEKRGILRGQVDGTTRRYAAQVETTLIDSMLNELEALGFWDLRDFSPRDGAPHGSLRVSLCVKHPAGRRKKLFIHAPQMHRDPRALPLCQCLENWLSQALPTAS